MHVMTLWCSYVDPFRNIRSHGCTYTSENSLTNDFHALSVLLIRIDAKLFHRTVRASHILGVGPTHVFIII